MITENALPQLVRRTKSAAARLACACQRIGAAEAGMSTVEYAVGTIAAAAFGAVLYGVVTGDSIVKGLTDIIDKALQTSI